MDRSPKLELWYEALASEFGLILSVSDPEFVRQKLYALRAKSGDADLESISLVVSPTNPQELWMVKRNEKS